MEQKFLQGKEKRISILGDSISTFEGYTPARFVFYDSYMQRETGVKNVEDTWWMQVIRALGGVLGVNHSLAGSMVSGNLVASAMSEKRIHALGENGEPDVILVSAGCNDWGFCVLPEEFEDSYREMLRRLKCRYPNAVICCCTLPEGKEPSAPEMAFFNAESTISKKVYSDIIGKLVKQAEVLLVDLEAYGCEYETVDGVHPTKSGMDTLAKMWIMELRKSGFLTDAAKDSEECCH